MTPRRTHYAVQVTAALVLTALLIIGARGAGPLPPMGPLLDPVHGIWAAARGAELRSRDMVIESLGGEVRVVYDTRGVPHIFAASVDDATRALGFVVARDRLFQMELVTRAASGRLTELAGPRALETDRAQRRLGLPLAAERRMKGIDTSSAGWRAIHAYAEGVNAWISSLRAQDIPVEYHLLGVRPARWEPIQSLHLLNRMTWTLAYSERELRMRQVELLVGREAATALFPRNSPIQEPIVPNGNGTPRIDVTVIPPPRPLDARESSLLGALASVHDAVVTARDRPAGEGADALGSNNWAVAPRRTRNGYALLAGDPHLELTLPSIWYEAHIVVPGQLDVYGVTIPGAPGIIIGFNRDVAWSFTNVESDVVDYFVETVDDPRHPARYQLDGEWKPLEQRVETYRNAAGEVVAVDTMLYTHRGPLVREGLLWLSLRWTAHDVTNENDALVRAARASTVDQWLHEMTAFHVPAQNAIVADRQGTIAIRSTGRFPLRAPGAMGSMLQDGSSKQNDWRGELPLDRYPFAINPGQGFLASANQQPLDPRADTTYLGAGWYSPWRAIRINELLRADSLVTADVMRRHQTDPGSARAEMLVPAILEIVRTIQSSGGGDSLLATGARLLAEWDRRYTMDNERAVLFENIMTVLQDGLWDELARPTVVPSGDTPLRVDTPNDQMVALLLRDGASRWWDVRATRPEVETREQIVGEAVRSGYRQTRQRYGDPSAGGWRWDRVHHANIFHLLRLQSMSRLKVPVQGGPATLSPSSGTGRFGASWRMVVELAPDIRAWTIYPGGQSGHPASSRYADRVSRWSAGALDTVLVPRDERGLPAARIASRLVLRSR